MSGILLIQKKTKSICPTHDISGANQVRPECKLLLKCGVLLEMTHPQRLRDAGLLGNGLRQLSAVDGRLGNLALTHLELRDQGTAVRMLLDELATDRLDLALNLLKVLRARIQGLLGCRLQRGRRRRHQDACQRQARKAVRKPIQRSGTPVVVQLAAKPLGRSCCDGPGHGSKGIVVRIGRLIIRIVGGPIGNPRTNRQPSARSLDLRQRDRRRRARLGGGVDALRTPPERVYYCIVNN